MNRMHNGRDQLIQEEGYRPVIKLNFSNPSQRWFCYTFNWVDLVMSNFL